MSLKIAFDWHLRYSASAVHHKRPFFVNPPSLMQEKENSQKNNNVNLRISIKSHNFAKDLEREE